MQGNQKPRICWIPPGAVSSTGQEAIELCRMAGLILDPWQEYCLVNSLGEKIDGTWAAPEVGIVVPRQNGKNGIVEARELTGLFLICEELGIHSAHQYDTSIEAYRRLRFLVENTPELDRRVARYINSHGEEGIELKRLPTVSVGPGGLSRGRAPRIRFRTRTKGGGRGFSGDLVVFDEAMIFPEASLAAILPVVSARPNPQVWYTGSAVDQAIHDQGLVLARIRNRGMAGGDPRLAYFEWSVDRPTPADVEPELLTDPEAIAEANPALGIRISLDYALNEAAALGPRSFAVERLGVGDWPDPDVPAETVIDIDTWNSREDPHAQFEDPVAFAFDVQPDRSSAAIGAGGVSLVGRPLVEVVAEQPGVRWVVPWLIDRHNTHKPLVIACDGTGAAASLLVELEQAGIEVVAFSPSDHARAAGAFYDDVMEGRLTHLGQHSLSAAVRGATQRPLGGAWAWNRRTSAVNISPLVACTLALAAYKQKSGEKPKAPPRVISLANIPDD